jgi:hypothetical protein
LRDFPIFLVWILVSIALALVVSLTALVSDSLAERWSSQEKTKQLVRRVLLITATERVAGAIDRLDFGKLATYGGVGLLLLGGAYLLLPLAGSVVSAIVLRNIFWVLVILIIGGVVVYGLRRA